MTPVQSLRIQIAVLKHQLAEAEQRADNAEWYAVHIEDTAAAVLFDAGFRAELPPSIAAVFAGCPNA